MASHLNRDKRQANFDVLSYDKVQRADQTATRES